MKSGDSDISRFCYKIQSYRRTFGKLLDEFLNRRYISESKGGEVSIESNSKLKIIGVRVSKDVVKDKTKLEELTKSCMENLFREYTKCLNDVKSEFNSMKTNLKRECDPKILSPSSKRIVEN